MSRDVTLTFDDGTSHQYNGVPDDATPDQVEARAFKDFPQQKLKNIDGGKKAPAAEPKPSEKNGVDKSVDKTAAYVKDYASGVSGAVTKLNDAAKGDNIYTTQAKQALGAGETALGVVGGITGDVLGAATSTVTQNSETGAKVRDAIAKFTAPRTETGKAIAGTVGAVMKPAGDLFELLPKYLEENGHKIAAQDLRAILDVAGGEEAVLGKGAKAVAKDAGKAAVADIAKQVEKESPAVDRQAAVNAQKAGYSLPPSQTKAGGVTGALAETGGGKTRLNEEFSIKNQTNSEKAVREHFGIAGEGLTEEIIKTEKQKLGAAWDAADNLTDTAVTKKTGQNPNQVTPATFQKADFKQKVADIQASVDNPIFNGALKSQFKKLGNLDTISTKQLSTTVKRLRDKKSELYASQNPTDAAAAGKLADLLDSTFERHLKDTGQSPAILQRVKDSRRQYAELSAVQDAFNKEGVFDARKLADNDEGLLKGKLGDVAAFGKKYRDYAKPSKIATGASKGEQVAHLLAATAGAHTSGLAAVPSAVYVAGRAGKALVKSDRFQRGTGKAKTAAEETAKRVEAKNSSQARKRAALRTTAGSAITAEQMEDDQKN